MPENHKDGGDGTVLLYATFANAADAERIGGTLVDQGLAACANILPAMTAIYVWQGQRCRDSEAVMIVKTRASLADTVIATVRGLHSYENPAIVVLPIVGGSADFLAWVAIQTRPRSDSSP